MRIWEKYFLRQFFRVFVLMLVMLFGLYVLIDYTSRLNHFHNYTIIALIYHYFEVFLLRADILVPFALLTATIRTLTHLNTHHELIALRASGISLKRLMRPFLLVGIICAGLLLISAQTLLPGAFRYLHQQRDSTVKVERGVQYLVLKDESRILYKNYLDDNKTFTDVFWVRSIDDVIHMKSLTPNLEGGVGTFVDHLGRDSEGHLIVQSSESSELLKELKIDLQALDEAMGIPAALSLTDLWYKWRHLELLGGDAEAQMETLLLKRLCFPLLCLFVVIIPAPLCMRFTRQLPLFLIYSTCLGALIAFYLILNAMTVLSESRTLAPLWAIGLPFAFAGLLTAFSFRK